jgi:hypothetical protein
MNFVQIKKVLISQPFGMGLLIVALLLSWFGGNKIVKPVNPDSKMFSERSELTTAVKIKIYDIAGADNDLAGVAQNADDLVFDGSDTFSTKHALGSFGALRGGAQRLPQMPSNKRDIQNRGNLFDMSGFDDVADNISGSGHSGWGWLADDVKSSESLGGSISTRRRSAEYHLLDDNSGGGHLGQGSMLGGSGDGFRSSRRTTSLWE